MGKFMAGMGGARKGSGRKKGSGFNKKSQALAEKLALQGATPLEVMLDGMRYYQKLADQVKAQIEGKEFQKNSQRRFLSYQALKANAFSCAKDAAPYLHPKLASVESKVTVTNHEAALTELE